MTTVVRNDFFGEGCDVIRGALGGAMARWRDGALTSSGAVADSNPISNPIPNPTPNPIPNPTSIPNPTPNPIPNPTSIPNPIPNPTPIPNLLLFLIYSYS